MKIEFHGTYKNEITKQYGLMLNLLYVRLKSGDIITLDRDETEYTLENGTADIVFRNTYDWNSDEEEFFPNYDLCPEDFDGAEIVEYEIEDDAPEGYDLEITIPQKISAW